jgi:hypothetical protein
MNNLILKSIDQSNQIYSRSGKKKQARSTDKLIPVHGCVASVMNTRQDKIFSLGHKNKSKKNRRILGKLYPQGIESHMYGFLFDKKVDIAIESEDGKIKKAILVKMPQSCYAKNKNNSIEHLIGENYNLRKKDNIIGQLHILPRKIPVLDKKGKTKNIEEITAKDIDPFIEIYKLPINDCVRPNFICLMIVDRDENNNLFLVSAEQLGITDIEKIEIYNKISNFELFIGEFNNAN